MMIVVYVWCNDSVLQMGFSCSPWSRFMVLSVLRIHKASCTFLLCQCVSRQITSALSQRMLWWVLLAWTAMPLVVCPLSTALWCSLRRSSRVLPVPHRCCRNCTSLGTPLLSLFRQRVCSSHWWAYSLVFFVIWTPLSGWSSRYCDSKWNEGVMALFQHNTIRHSHWDNSLF